MSTRKEVAAMSGVSVATVSHVIRKNKYVSPELVARVNDAVKALDYCPNMIARSLSTKQTHHVGLIINNTANTYYGEIALGMSKVASQYGYTVSIFFTGDEPNSYVTSAVQRQLDGLFVATNGAMFTDEQYKTMLNNNIKFVNSTMAGAGSIVAFNYADAVKQMVAYLAGLGHKKIGFLCGIPKTTKNFVRYSSFKAALAENNLPVLDDCIIENDAPYHNNQYDGYNDMKKLLALNTGVTAVFCLNDVMALGALKAIHEAGLRVPQDISVVGCDDVFFSSCIEPSLTTLSVPKEEMGRQAMFQILNQIKTGKTEEVNLNVELVVRSSTGPAPAAE